MLAWPVVIQVSLCIMPKVNGHLHKMSFSLNPFDWIRSCCDRLRRRLNRIVTTSIVVNRRAVNSYHAPPSTNEISSFVYFPFSLIRCLIGPCCFCFPISKHNKQKMYCFYFRLRNFQQHERLFFLFPHTSREMFLALRCLFRRRKRVSENTKR